MRETRRAGVILAVLLMGLYLSVAQASEQLPTPKEVARVVKKVRKAERRAEKTAKREHKAVERERQKQEIAKEKADLQRLHEDIRDKKATDLYENVALFAVGTLFGIFIGRFLRRIGK